MRVLAQGRKIDRATKSSTPDRPDSAHLGLRLDGNLILQLQRTIGNRAVQRLLKRRMTKGERASGAPGMASFDYRFSPTQMPVSRAAPMQRRQLDGEVESPEGTATVQSAEQPESGSVAPPVEKEPVRNAPAATYSVPFDHHPLAAAGERIIFRGVFTDPSPHDYQLEYSTTGGHFTSANGAVTKTIAGLDSGNVDFFVPTPWNGRAAVQVVLKVRKNSDNSIAQTETWDFGLKTHYPTTMAQREGTGEGDLPGVYTYDIGPALASGAAPFYQHLTILERFGKQTLANIEPADIKPAYRASHSLNSKAAVSQHFVDSGSGGNGTFTVDANDRIADQHGGHDDLTNLVNNLTAPKDIEVVLPQTYEAKPSVALGKYKITRVLKADGTTWKVKKGPTR
jgi:hypothetical protein